MGEARILHHFHPLFGKSVKVVSKRYEFGEDRVFYYDGSGHIAWIPASWTDVVTTDLYIATSAGRAFFKTQDLLELVELVKKCLS